MLVVTNHPSETLIEQASQSLRQYLESGRRRTDLLRETAERIVEIRSRSFLSDGRADWSGWSSEYRAAASDIYRRAGVPKEQLGTVQTALRYHVQNMIRERAPEHELDAVGLDTVSPKQRLTRDREAMAALAATVATREERHDVLRLVSYAETLVRMIDAGEVRKLDDVNRRAFLVVARDLREHLQAAMDAAEAGV